VCAPQFDDLAMRKSSNSGVAAARLNLTGRQVQQSHSNEYESLR
jgi:hypothetical protein